MHLAEFLYNNSYQASIKMPPFEALYGRKCRSPLCWDEVDENGLLGSEIITVTVDKIKTVRRHMRAAQDRRKKWADMSIRPLEFEAGDHVFLKISPTRGVIRFGVKGKLSPRFIGPFEVLEKLGAVAYRIALPPSLAAVHNVFHVLQLRRYVRDDSHVLDHSELELRSDLSYEAQPVSIVDRREKILKGRTIRLVRVSWDPHSPGESTWELEDKIKEKYPHLFR